MIQADIIEYKRSGGVPLHMHVLRDSKSNATEKRPAVVFFTCGGWHGFNPKKLYPQSEYLASRGMVAFNPEVRSVKLHGTGPRECVIDARSAVRWVRSHAERFGVDPARIAAGGGSASGHVSCCTTMLDDCDDPLDPKGVSSGANALLLFNPALDTAGKPSRVALAGGVENARAISPLEHVRPELPPTLVLHGRDDTVVPIAEALRFTELMRKAGNRCELEIYEREGHGFFNWYDGNNPMFRETLRRADRFLASLGWIQGPAGIDSFTPTITKDINDMTSV